MSLEIFENILVIFFRHQIKIKMFHFQTTSYASHKASDSYLAEFEGKLDRFMEVAQGVVGKFQTKNINFNINTLNDETIIGELDGLINTLRLFDNLIKQYTELLNIRDEMVADAQQFKYLLSFK